MTNEQDVLQRFQQDIAQHQMEVILDQGAHRHLRFSRPDTMCMHFDLVTWPGLLCYSGDMGTMVFERLRDMFEFFRSGVKGDGTLRPNHSYWAEKLVAVDGNRFTSGCEEFDPEEFARVVRQYRRQLVRSRNRTPFRWVDHGSFQTPVRDDLGAPCLTKEQRRDLWDAIDCDVLSKADEGEERAMVAAHDFSWSPDWEKVDSYYFQDFSEHRCKRYTFHFQWACLAIPWGIHQYDKAKTEALCQATAAR